jgi:hypothetical protein
MISVASGIQSRHPNNQGAAGLILTTHCQQDQLICNLLLPNKYIVYFGGGLMSLN